MLYPFLKPRSSRCGASGGLLAGFPRVFFWGGGGWFGVFFSSFFPKVFNPRTHGVLIRLLRKERKKNKKKWGCVPSFSPGSVLPASGGGGVYQLPSAPLRAGAYLGCGSARRRPSPCCRRVWLRALGWVFFFFGRGGGIVFFFSFLLSPPSCLPSPPPPPPFLARRFLFFYFFNFFFFLLSFFPPRAFLLSLRPPSPHQRSPVFPFAAAAATAAGGAPAAEPVAPRFLRAWPRPPPPPFPPLPGGGGGGSQCAAARPRPGPAPAPSRGRLDTVSLREKKIKKN